MGATPRRPGQVARALIAIIALGVTAHVARADDSPDLAKARAAVDSSDYPTAKTALAAALAAGKAEPTELGEIYQLTGIVDAALGDPQGATEAFGKWIVLDGRAALPAGTSPKIKRPFDAAVAAAKKRDPLAPRTDTTDDPPSITLTIERDAFKLVTRARAFVRVDGKPEKLIEGTPGSKILLPLGHRLDMRVQGLDDAGNRVVELGTKEVPIEQLGRGAAVPDVAVVAPKPRPAPRGPVHERRLLWRWWLWGTASLAFAGGATYFGFEVRSAADQLRDIGAHSTQHVFSDAQSVASSGQRDALLCNVGIGIAGALAVGATILYLTAPRAANETETRVAATPLPGGGAIVLGGHF
jgi:hypothetical protein